MSISTASASMDGTMGRRCVAALPLTRMPGKSRFLGSVCDRELPRDVQRCAGNRKSERTELASPVTDADRDARGVRFLGARQGSKTCTGCATDGTPFLSVRKSMYQPGGAMFGSPVSVTRTVPPACEVIGRSTRRCPVLNECVVTP